MGIDVAVFENLRRETLGGSLVENELVVRLAERAKAAGAETTREIEDTPYDAREYTAKDPEGHVWSCGTYRPKVGA